MGSRQKSGGLAKISGVSVEFAGYTLKQKGLPATMIVPNIDGWQQEFLRATPYTLPVLADTCLNHVFNFVNIENVHGGSGVI